MTAGGLDGVLAKPWRRSDAIPITAEAEAKIAAYAKGDAAWAAELAEEAYAIAGQAGLPVVDAAVVKASLLQIWTRQQRLPEWPAVAQGGTAADAPPAAATSDVRAASPQGDTSGQSSSSGVVVSTFAAARAWLTRRRRKQLRLAAAAVVILLSGWS